MPPFVFPAAMLGFEVGAGAEAQGAGKATLGEREPSKHSTAQSFLLYIWSIDNNSLGVYTARGLGSSLPPVSPPPPPRVTSSDIEVYLYYRINPR